MTDDLVSNLREMARQYTDNQYNLYARSADRIEKLEELVKRLRDDNSSLIDDFDKDFLRQETRIEKLEAALTHIWAWHPISVSRPHDTINAIRDFAFATIKGEKHD